MNSYDRVHNGYSNLLMGRQYTHPPLVEAVCEFRFLPDTKWDLTIPGLMYEKVQDRFPHKEQRVVSEMEISQQGTEIKQQVRTSERIWFLVDDRKLFIQLSSNFLAVNCLAPYPTWNVFRPEIERAYDTALRLVEIRGLQRIGLRFVNRIEIASPRINLEEYFEFRPHLGERLPQDLASFITGSVLPFSEARDMCRVQLTTAVAEQPERNTFILDIDYFLSRPQEVAPNEAITWIEKAHENLETVFEGCITDRLREIFGGA